MLPFILHLVQRHQRYTEIFETLDAARARSDALLNDLSLTPIMITGPDGGLWVGFNWDPSRHKLAEKVYKSE